MNLFVKWYKKSEYLLYFGVSVLLGFTPILWFKGKMLAGEEHYALDYARWGRTFSEFWFTRVNWGESSPLIPFKLQWYFFEFLYKAGFSEYSALITWNVMLSVVAAAAFYILLYAVFGKRFGGYLYLFGVVYYLFNPYFLNISPLLSPPRIMFAVMPVVLLILFRIFMSPEKSWLYLYILNIVILLASPIFVNLPLGGVLIGLIYLSLFYIYAVVKVPVVKFLKYIGYFTMFLFLFNLWWLLPTGYKQLGGLGSLQSEAADFVTINRTKTADILSLFGSWALREKIWATPYYYFPYYKYYDNILGLSVRYFPFVIIGYGLYYFLKTAKRNKENYILFYFFAGYLLFLFLSKGTSPPLGSVYKFLYLKVPLFWMYREPYAKFTPVAALFSGLLFVYGLGALSEKVRGLRSILYRNIVSFVFVLITSVLLAYLGIYLINGNFVFNVNDGNIRAHLVDIPEEWREIRAKWKPKEGYYLLYPSLNLYDLYKWPSGYSGNPWLALTDAKLLNPEKSYTQSELPERRVITYYLMRNLLTNPSAFIEESQRFGLSGIILQKDTAYDGYSYTYEIVKSNFNDYLVFSNSSADIYEFNELPIDVSLLSGDVSLNLPTESFANYKVLKKVLNEYPLITQTTEPTDNIKEYTPDPGLEDNTVIYKLTGLSQNNELFIFGNTGNIKNVYLDNTEIVPQVGDEDYFHLNTYEYPGCCSGLRVELKVPPVEYIESRNPWYRMPVESANISNLEEAPDNAVKLRTGTVYMTKIAGFNPDLNSRVSLEISSNYNAPFGISLIQVDNGSGATKYISSYMVKELMSTISLIYEGVKNNNFINTTENADYYLGIFPLNLSDEAGNKTEYPKDIAMFPGNVTIENERTPYVFSLPNKNFEYTITDIPEYKEIGNSVILVETNSINHGKPLSVHLKRAYNKDWRVLFLGKEEYDSYYKEGLGIADKYKLIGLSRSAKLPVNAEYYSNLWVFSEDNVREGTGNTEGAGYLMFVFWPAFLADLSWVFSAMFVVLSSGVVLAMGSGGIPNRKDAA